MADNDNPDTTVLRIAEPFILNSALPADIIIAEFVKAARAFADISEQELARRIMRNHTELNNSTPRIRSATDIMRLERSGYLRLNNGRLNLATLVAIAHACKLNLEVTVTPKNITTGGTAPTQLFKVDQPVDPESGYNIKDVFSLQAGKIFTMVEAAIGCRTSSNFAAILGIKPSRLSNAKQGKSGDGSQYGLPQLRTLLSLANKTDSELTLTLNRPSPTLTGPTMISGPPAPPR